MYVKRGERGLTLIEVVITMSLMGVVSLALADLVTTALHQISATSDRLDMAQDAQLGATYFSRDVAAATSVEADAGGNDCGPSSQAVVRLLSDRWDPAQRTAVVAYYLSGTELHRASCLGSSSTDVRVASNVQSGSLAVSCTAACRQVSVRFLLTRPAAGEHEVVLSGLRRPS